MHKTENKSLWKDEVSYGHDGSDTWYMGRIYEVWAKTLRLCLAIHLHN